MYYKQHHRKVLDFIDEVYADFKFRKMLCDNGREFDNMQIKRWAREKCISLEYSTPYYHASNGRVERANRTFREAIEKENKQIKMILGKVMCSYS